MAILAGFAPLLLFGFEAALVLAVFIAFASWNERRTRHDPVFFAHWYTVAASAIVSGVVSVVNSIVGGATIGAGLVRDTAVLVLGLCIFVGASAFVFDRVASQSRRLRIALSFAAGFAVLPVAVWVMLMASCVWGGGCL